METCYGRPSRGLSISSGLRRDLSRTKVGWRARGSSSCRDFRIKDKHQKLEQKNTRIQNGDEGVHPEPCTGLANTVPLHTL